MSTLATAAAGSGDPASPFAGRRHLPRGRPHAPPRKPPAVFEDDEWDFTDVIGLPVQMRLASRRFDFAAIGNPRWRLVAKELIVAMLAPRHEAVARCPRLPDASSPPDREAALHGLSPAG